VRPLTLKLNGVRSYRQEQTIDFADKEIVAIIGDTGAGKSSILEAICFALYGKCTWKGTGASDLIADGGDGTLRVELTFRAQSKTWTITRAISRAAYPPSIHRLVCLEGDTDISGREPVDAKIINLIGFDYDTFLKTVILPQGRFQELLQTPESGRTAILKKILGLDILATIRDTATTMYTRLNAMLGEMEIRRAALLPDPAAVIRKAQYDLGAVGLLVARLRSAIQRIVTINTQITEHGSHAVESRKAKDRLTRHVDLDLVTRYGALLEIEIDLDAEVRPLQERVGGRVERRDELSAVLAAAEAEGTGSEAVNTAFNLLSTMNVQVSELAQDRLVLADMRTKLADERDLLQSLQDSASKRLDASAAADEAVDTAKIAAEQAAEKLSSTKVLLQAARDASNQLATAYGVAQAATNRVRTKLGLANIAGDEAAAAERTLEAADYKLDATRRAQSAAHASSGSHPGDPCPVCNRDLPDDFVPPKADGLSRATDERGRASYDAVQARERATRTRTEAEAEAVAAQEKQEVLVRLQTDATKAISDLYMVLGQVDLANGDDTLLAYLNSRVEDLSLQYGKAEERAALARDAATRVTTKAELTRANLDTRERDIKNSEMALARKMRNLAAKANDLPAKYQIVGEPNHLTIDDRLKDVLEQQEALKGITEEIGDIMEEVEAIRGLIHDLDQRRRTEVEGPARQLGGRLRTLVQRSEDVAELLSVEIQVPPTVAGLADEAAWAAAALTEASRLVSLAENKVNDEESAARALQSELETIMDEFSASTLSDLEERYVLARTEANLARQRLEGAISQLPMATELDRRIAGARPAIESLAEVSRLLADGKFVASVVQRRQRTLLGIATGRLRIMTGNRFAFASDFRIIDGFTGQPRGVKTLSGGETFQASLALALAVVELAARSGGRVEALFLDEGFGTLDANAVTQALETLTEHASGGRLVAIISHMQAIADNLEHVLAIDKTYSGSQARWASLDGLGQRLAEEVSSGLLG
jgi:DNA repair exonuclease SbcCD ATPase subunit